MEQRRYKYLSNDTHIELYERFNHLSDSADAGYDKCYHKLMDEIKNNYYPIEVMNEIVNQGEYNNHNVLKFYYIIPYYPNYKSITFEEDTINCLKNKWTDIYDYIQYNTF